MGSFLWITSSPVSPPDHRAHDLARPEQPARIPADRRAQESSVLSSRHSSDRQSVITARTKGPDSSPRRSAHWLFCLSGTDLSLLARLKIPASDNASSWVTSRDVERSETAWPIHRPIDIDHLRQWIGRTEEKSDLITPHLVAALRATLFGEPGAPVRGDIAPETVHWCLTPPIAPMSQLGIDGHPTRGGFLPSVPLPRRMWAGGRLELLDPLRVGDEVKRTSCVMDVTLKHGSTGTLCFVTVEHQYTTARGIAVRERHDIVYRDIASVRCCAPCFAQQK